MKLEFEEGLDEWLLAMLLAIFAFILLWREYSFALGYTAFIVIMLLVDIFTEVKKK